MPPEKRQLIAEALLKMLLLIDIKMTNRIVSDIGA